MTRTREEGLPIIDQLDHADYMPVGSWLPLHEFIYTFDILEMFMHSVKGMYNIPRSIQEWDAISICPIKNKGIKTFIVIDGKLVEAYRNHTPQFKPDKRLALVPRTRSFPSFRYPSWPRSMS